MTEAQLAGVIPDRVRPALAKAGLLSQDAPSEEVRRMLTQMSADFQDKAPVSAA